MKDFKKRCIAFILATLYFLTPTLLCYAEKVKTIEGLIEDISNDSIKVRGKYYNISDTPLKDTSGKTVSKDQLKIGKRVEIFFHNDKIISVIIHEYLVD
ncbi:MAG: hypothetical protein HXY47_01450 [Nitrospirae bacterium]|nr:hypothetical protein [Nitrospirota bacterium]